jgi:hypothetical protein
MFEIKINQLSGELFKVIYVKKLLNTFLEIKEVFMYFKCDKYFKIVNIDDIIYTDLYNLDYDNIILNDNLTIIFLDYDTKIIHKIKNNYCELENASYEIKNNKDIIKMCCIKNGFALQYASDELRAMPSKALCA